MNDEATYICPACGEEIVIPLDHSAGVEQEYVEDCPADCRGGVSRDDWWVRWWFRRRLCG